MLTKGEHRMLETTITMAARLCLFPFLKNDGKDPTKQQQRFDKFIVRNKLRHFLPFFTSLLVTFLHSIYAVIRFIPGYGYTRENFRNLHYSIWIHGILIASWITAGLMEVAALRHADELVTLINQILHFNKAHGKRFIRAEYTPPNLVEKLLSAMFIYGWMILACLILLSVVIPNNVYTIFSSLPHDRQSPMTLLLSAVIEAHGWVKIYYVNWFTFVGGYAYVKTNKWWLQKICIEWMGSHSTTAALNGIGMYRSLTILNTIFNSGFTSSVVLLLKTGMEFGVLFCMFCIVRLHGTENQIFVYLFAGGIGAFCLTQLLSSIVYMAGVYEWSSELDLAVRRSTASKHKELSRLRRSVRPIVCKIGILFFIERSTKLTYITLLLHSFISILLTFAR